MLNKISDRIYYMEHQTTTDRPVLGYIKGNKYSLMVDAGNSLKHAVSFLRKLIQTGLDTPDFVAITHKHWDHCYGLHAINAVSIASRMTNEALKEMSQWLWNDHLLSKYTAEDKIPLFCEEHIRKEYPDLSKIIVKPADVTFEDEMTLDLGGVSCQLIRIGSTHTKDSIVVYIPEEKVIFMGDADCETLVRDTWVDDKKTLGKLIERLEKLDFDVFIPGHDAPTTKHEALEELRERYSGLE